MALIHLETTSDLPENAHIPDILEALVAELSTHECIVASEVKAYHSLRSNWAVGSGHPDGIAHCTISVKAGSDRANLVKIANSISGILREHFGESLTAKEVGVTLELRETDAQLYRIVTG
jgi:5-carboxymethyl-2-hydroxymuconate isomerase